MLRRSRVAAIHSIRWSGASLESVKCTVYVYKKLFVTSVFVCVVFVKADPCRTRNSVCPPTQFETVYNFVNKNCGNTVRFILALTHGSRPSV